MIKRAFLLFLLMQVSACAFGDATLNIQQDPSKVSKGLISTVASKKVSVTPPADVRPQTNLIGYKRNGFGSKTADVKTQLPVTQIVQDALTQTLAANGHVVDANSPFTINSTVKTFWFDQKIGLVSVEFMGDVEVELTITNRNTSQKLFQETYLGHYTQENMMGGLEGTWTHVMNEAVADMSRKVSLSPTLKQALEQIPN